MTSQRSHLAIIIVASLLPMKSIAQGSRESCPPSAVVDLTGETLNTSETVNKSGDLFPPEVLWLENDTLFGCLCGFKVCVPLCCPVGYAAGVGGCVTDNFTFQSSPYDYEICTKDRHVFINDPCKLSWTKDIVQQENYILLQREASPIFANRIRTLDWRGFCIFRKLDSWEYFTTTCTVPKWTHPWICLTICASISTIFALATFIVYTVIPELKNLSGSILRCYLASYISCTLLMCLNTVLLLAPWTQGSSKIKLVYSLINVFIFFYFGVACMFWLNVMSVDIWRTFRKFCTSGPDNKAQQKAKFVRYSIYAWGCPALSTLTVLSINGLGTMYGCSESTLESIEWYLMILPLISIAICSTCLYTSTALTIRKRKKETAHMVDGVNKHQTESEQRFNLYVKLFVIMGVPQILSVVAFFGDDEKFYCVIYVTEVLQGIAIFFMFVWKDDVKELLHKKFSIITRRLSTASKNTQRP